MTLKEAMVERHSVRRFTEQKLDDAAVSELQKAIDECNKKSGLNIQLILNEPEAFGSGMAKYGNFENCSNYIAIAGKKNADEICGYYGEQIVLLAQQLGLNTCWVALTFNKSKAVYELNDGEKLLIVIALGYGQTQGKTRPSKPIEELCTVKNGEMPDWFKSAMIAVMLAPTAVNQQKFHFTLDGNRVEAKTSFGFYSKIDLGIAKYHFEVGAGNADFVWAEED
ncbi:MAG: nitroreductase [Clostridia bacterium]|nr:nitroreductase [Clostridia bacterium]